MSAPQKTWPDGFEVDGDDLYKGTGDTRQLVARGVRLKGRARNRASEQWSYVLEAVDPDGVVHEELLPCSAVAPHRQEIVHLRDKGFDIVDDRALKAALQDAPRDLPRIRLVDRPGWFDDVFLLPDGTYGATAEPVRLARTRTDHRFRVSGTLDDWKREVAALGSGNPRLLLGFALAFSGPVFGLLDEAPIGVHLRGASSTGKTTVLLAAGSVWGGGGAKGFLQSWRATDNALEGLAELHNDTLLAIDEIGETDGAIAAKAIYALLNGQGKARAQITGDLSGRKGWRTPLLSTGELSLADKIAEAGRRGSARAGLEVRLLDVEAVVDGGFGVFNDLHGFSDGAAFARAISERVGRFHGTAGRAFVEALTMDAARSRTELKIAVDAYIEQFSAEGSGGTHLRVARALAVVAAAGEFAQTALDVPWGPDECARALGDVIIEWRRRFNAKGVEHEKALRAIRAAIDEQRGRFVSRPSEHPGPTYDRLGIVQGSGASLRYCFFETAFDDLMARESVDPSQAKRTLRDAGVTEVAPGRLLKQVRIPDSDERKWMVVVDPAKLGGSFDEAKSSD